MFLRDIPTPRSPTRATLTYFPSSSHNANAGRRRTPRASAPSRRTPPLRETARAPPGAGRRGTARAPPTTANPRPPRAPAGAGAAAAVGNARAARRGDSTPVRGGRGAAGVRASA